MQINIHILRQFSFFRQLLKLLCQVSYGIFWCDETYHRVLVDTKNKNGKGIKKAYVWVVTAVNTGLVYYF